VIASTADDQPDELGWIKFPSGQYTREAAVNLSGPANIFSDHENLSYDWAVKAWVPAERALVSPDGTSYVDGAYLVDAKTGKRRLILPRNGPAKGLGWLVLSYGSEGIYLGAAGGVEVPEAEPGLWLLDLLSGHVRLLDSRNFWSNFGAGVAWGPGRDPGSDSAIYRIDLATAKVTKLSLPVGAEVVSPTGDGDLIVGIPADDGSEPWFVFTGAGQLISLTLPSDFDYGYIFPAEIAQPGTWLPLETGVGLYTKASGLHVMARSPYGEIMFPMGDCR
jgi:hypothetical protein